MAEDKALPPVYKKEGSGYPGPPVKPGSAGPGQPGRVPGRAARTRAVQIERGYAGGVGAAALGFLLGRAEILGPVFPYGAAFYAAARALGRSEGIIAGVGVALGAFTAAGPWGALKVLGAIILLELALRLRRFRPSETYAPLTVGAVTAVATAMAAIPFSLRAGPEEYRYVALAFESFLAGGLAVAFTFGVRVLVAPFAFRAPSTEEVLCAALMATAAVTGLSSFQLAGLNLQNVFGSMLVMAGSYFGGAGLGAAVGATFGGISGLSSTILPGLLGTFAFSGLLAGIFKDLGRLGVALGFVFGQLILGFTAETTEALNRVLGEAISAGALFFLIPRSVLESIAGVLGGRGPARGPLEAGEAAPELTARDLTGRRLRELGQVFRELGRAFEQVSGAAEVRAGPIKDRSDLAPLFTAIAERACEGCSIHRTCWDVEFFRTFHGLENLWAAAEDSGGVPLGQIPEEIRRRCIRASDLVGTVNYFYDLYRVNRYWEKKVAESREIVSDQLKGVSKIMEGLAGEVRVSFDRESGRPAGARRSAPKLQYQVGVSRVAKKGSLISGDSFLSKTLEKEGKLILALSDGMGAGPRAAVESRATISLLEKLLETGFDIDIAVKTINSTLLLRSPDEMFATVDLAIIDLVSGNSEFIKIGAAPSFIKRGSEVTAIKTASLPIGILSQIEIESTRRVLGSGDMVVMMTDGLLEVRKDLADKEAWVTRVLKEFPRNEPQILAETLLSGALEGNRREVGDDITVMVLRLDSVDREAAGEESAPAETGPYRWAKAQWKKIR